MNGVLSLYHDLNSGTNPPSFLFRHFTTVPTQFRPDQPVYFTSVVM